MQRIIGPPGCGKTTHLGRICKSAAKKYGSESVMVISLTRAAAAAVAEKEIDGERIPLPKGNIGTLHSMAYKALEKPEIADTPKNLKLWNEWIVKQGYPIYRVTIEGGDVDDSAVEARTVIQTSGDDAYQSYGISRAKLEPVDSLTQAHQGWVEWWERFKSEHNMMDFSEMLDRAYLDIDEAPGRPKVILLDEGQDTPKLGMRLVRKWGEKAEWFFVVGDPLQNLYHWAGTDPEAFTYPVLPQDQQTVLAQSYRVPRKIRDFAFSWIEPHRLEVEAQIGKRIEYHPRLNAAGDPVEGKLRPFPSASYKYPEPAIQEAVRQMEKGKDVMFIAACSYMLQPTIACLRKQGIPFWNPYRPTRGDWNPLHAARGTSSAQRLLSFLRLDERVWGEDVRVWNAKELWQWTELLEAKGVLKNGAKAKIKTWADRAVAHDEDGRPLPAELTLADLSECFDDLDEMVNVMGMIAEGTALDWLFARLLGGKRKGMEFPMAITRHYGPQKLRQQPRLVVGTIHSLKGTQADVAIVFPDLSSSGMGNWTKPGPDKEGVRRAFYVAFTRAKETLILCQRAGPNAIQYPSLHV